MQNGKRDENNAQRKEKGREMKGWETPYIRVAPESPTDSR